MTSARTVGRGAFAALLGFAVLVWTVMPATSHAPTILETLHEHAEMIAEQGHSHGLEEDLAWAMHGHGHDSADHDHSQAVLTPGLFPQPFEVYTTAWRLDAAPPGLSMAFLIERPPRV